MKKLLFFAAFAALSCNSDDGFDEANGNVAKKYVTKIITTGDGNSNVSTVTYDNNKAVITTSDGQKINYFSYNNDGTLNKISGNGSNLLSSEVINTIHKAYEIGDVLQYDAKGNPSVLELFEDDYETGNKLIYTATLSYDDKPFTFYYTLDAAGIISVLNKTQLNFNFLTASPEIILAKKLLPVNNPYKAIIKDENNVEMARIDVSYNYGADKYPISSTIITKEDGIIEQSNVVYEYLP
jgi:hypothetical protein